MKCKIKCCISCHNEVIAEVNPFGDGYVGICTYCGKLAYNAKEKPPEVKMSLPEIMRKNAEARRKQN